MAGNGHGMIAIWVNEWPGRDISFTVNVVDDSGNAMLTLANFESDEPNLGIRLRDVVEAFRSGQKFMSELHAQTYTGIAEIAGSELPPRGEGIRE